MAFLMAVAERLHRRPSFIRAGCTPKQASEAVRRTEIMAPAK